MLKFISAAVIVVVTIIRSIETLSLALLFTEEQYEKGVTLYLPTPMLQDIISKDIIADTEAVGRLIFAKNLRTSLQLGFFIPLTVDF